MNRNNTYTIPLRELKAGNYQFDFKLDDAFFRGVETSEIQRGIVNVEAEVEKHNNMMLINFYFEGEVEVECDRCLDSFFIPIEFDSTLSVRFSNLMPNDEDGYFDDENSEEDIMFANPKDDVLDISHYLYESVCLSLPIQRIHPNDENGCSLCNKNMLDYLSQHKID